MVVRSIVFVGFYVDVGFLIKYYSTRKLDVSLVSSGSKSAHDHRVEWLGSHCE
ncbi:MAG: hypothetical protein QW446_05410 [Acidilobaceae archaeon]